MAELNVDGVAPTWTLGDHLRKARETRGLSQSELAVLIDVSRRSISTYESESRATVNSCTVPPGSNSVYYHYKFDFQSDGLGKPKADSDASPEYRLLILEN